MKKWRFIDTGVDSANWNMSVDEALNFHFNQNSLPILRLYRWEPSVSFGRFSKVRNELELKRLECSGISYARRITGGGILPHGGDISYSLVIPRSFIKAKGVKESYGYLCGFLLEFYKKLGLNADFAARSNQAIKMSSICLSGNESYDIIIQGRKIGGNAQKHGRDTLFQHGSIPLKFEKELLEPLFVYGSGIDEAASLSTLGIDKGHEELKEILLEAFCETFDAEMVFDSLTKQEMESAKKLLESKYSLKSWNIYAQKNSP